MQLSITATHLWPMYAHIHLHDSPGTLRNVAPEVTVAMCDYHVGNVFAAYIGIWQLATLYLKQKLLWKSHITLA